MGIREVFKIEGPANKRHEMLIGITQSATLLMKELDIFCVDLRITSSQFNILMVLKNHVKEGLTQQELCEHLLVTKSNVTRLLDRAQNKGLVQRRGHPDDKRINKVFITKKGFELVKKSEQKYFCKIGELTSNLDEKNVHQCIQSIECLVKKMRNSD